ncbi:hypothetical protein ABT072_45375, partial [Streptomyces sp. NPDC002589]
MRARRLALAATAALVALTAGCAHHDGASPKSPSATAPSAGPSQLPEMQKKVDSAEHRMLWNGTWPHAWLVSRSSSDR